MTDFALFEFLDPELRRRVLSTARRRTFARGEVVFHEGDPADTLQLLVSGRVRVQVTTPLGDVVTLTMLGAGSTFGELALVGEGARTATVVAVEPIETLSLPMVQLEALRREHPEVDRHLVALLAGYVRRLDQQLLDALYVPADRRVLRRLVGLAELYGTAPVEAPVTVPVTQDVLANMAGTTRPTANQALRALEDAGTLRISRGRIQVLDLATLRRRAG